MNSKEGLTLMRVAGAFGFWAFLAAAGCTGNVNNGSLPLTTTDRISVGVGVDNGGGDTAAECSTPSVSEDGRFVAFRAAMDSVPTGTLSAGVVQIHRRDMNLAPGSPNYVIRISAKFGGALATTCLNPS